MARLPQPGADEGVWGDILNDYLAQTLKPDGSIKDNAVTNAAIAPNAVTASEIAADTITATEIADGTIMEAQLDSAVQTKLNSVSAPAWSSITGKPAVIAAGADQATARAAIGAGTSSLVLGTTGSTAKAGDYAPTKSDVGLANVDNTADANKPISTATQTALDGKVGTSRSVATSGSLTGGGNLTADRTVSLVNDNATPGASRYYGTDGAGTKGFYSLPSSGGHTLSTLTSASTLSAAAGAQYITLLGSGAAPTLPTAVSNTSLYTLKNIHTATITIATTSSQTIEGQVGYMLSTNESITVVSDNANWRII